MMDEDKCSEVVYILYASRGELVSALEQYQTRYVATHTLPERAATLHMQDVILWTNGVVMVFDDRGEQMPEYQGIFERCYNLISNVFRGCWLYGDWRRGIISAVPL